MSLSRIQASGHGRGDLDKYAVGAVDRALGLLELLRDADRPLHLRDISRRLRMIKSTSYRLLCTLERRGYVERVDSGGRYQLGAVLRSYATLISQRSLTELSLPHMQALRAKWRETINLGVMRDGEVLYLEISESPQSFRMAATMGSRSPFHCTALGKAIAAFLPPRDVEELAQSKGLAPLTSRTIRSLAALKRELARIRIRGYAEENGETEPEASCVAAPIFDASGQVVAALSLSGPTSHVRLLKRDAADAIVAAATAISRDLGYAANGERRVKRTR